MGAGSRRASIVRAVLAGVLLAGAAQCGKARGESRGSAVAAAPDARSAPPAVTAFVRIRTTSPRIALSNLDGEIAMREARARAGDVAAQRELVGRYLLRAQFAGRIADLDAALAASAQLVAASGDGRAHLARAKALSAVHEFARAQKELDEAAALGADGTQVGRERGSILLAVGREDEAAPLLAVVEERATPADLVMRGALEARLGRGGEGERLFGLARARFRDVSPFVLAWMDFERARALELDGDRVAARKYLEEAADAMPSYAHAVAHLTALEPPDRALARVDPLSPTSDDPEVPAARADALRRAGRSAEAAAETARARAGYEAVLARLPLAFADHAANFYLGIGGDPARALTLARMNADNRPTDEALELWLTAAQAAGDADQSCLVAKRLLERPHPAAALHDRAARVARGCR